MNHTIFFLGVCMLQLVYIIYQFLLLKRIEYLYYILYFLCLVAVILFETFPEINPFPFLVSPEDNFKASRGLLVLGYAMYFKFGRYFTETKTHYTRLNRQLEFAESFLVIFGSVDIITQSIGLADKVMDIASNAVYVALIPFCIYVIIFMITRGRKLTNILVIGSSLLFICAVGGFVDVMFSSGTEPRLDFQLYLEVGVVLELLFLNFGLIYKTRMLEKDNIRLELAKQMELNDQRILISSDLHDEIGTTLSGIALYSHLAGKQMQQDQQPALEKSITIIQNSATEMVSKLNDIIWAVNPGHNNIEEMMTHVEEYLLKMAATKQINAGIKIHPSIKELVLPMLHRKNIYLICKEAINNSVKYSCCKEIWVEVGNTVQEMVISIRDNGIGFDNKIAKSGNGMHNMLLRAKQINAELQVRSSHELGTNIFLNCKIPQ
jgi:signal transduction histidine kinase